MVNMSFVDISELFLFFRRNIVDTRVHCCLYFLSPYGHGLRPLDLGNNTAKAYTGLGFFVFFLGGGGVHVGM